MGVSENVCAHQGRVLRIGDATRRKHFVVSNRHSVAQVEMCGSHIPEVTGSIPGSQKLNLRVLVFGVHQHCPARQ